ncbi:hypothetical protein NL676_027174 [Syzygium grande]|nr:hypothetical protein NL676_027174 [Syzygium grande]
MRGRKRRALKTPKPFQGSHQTYKIRSRRKKDTLRFAESAAALCQPCLEFDDAMEADADGGAAVEEDEESRKRKLPANAEADGRGAGSAAGGGLLERIVLSLTKPSYVLGLGPGELAVGEPPQVVSAPRAGSRGGTTGPRRAGHCRDRIGKNWFGVKKGAATWREEEKVTVCKRWNRCFMLAFGSGIAEWKSLFGCMVLMEVLQHIEAKCIERIYDIWMARIGSKRNCPSQAHARTRTWERFYFISDISCEASTSSQCNSDTSVMKDKRMSVDSNHERPTKVPVKVEDNLEEEQSQRFYLNPSEDEAPQSTDSLLICGQVDEALNVLEEVCHHADTALPLRVRAALLERFAHENVVELSSCYEEILKRDPTCCHSMARLVTMHQSGDYHPGSMLEMISLHLDATYAEHQIWREFAMCFLKLARREEDFMSVPLDGKEGGFRQNYSGRFNRIPDHFLRGDLGKNWRFRCRWWLTHHFSFSVLEAEIAAGNIHLLTCKAAGAAHMYGQEFEYVVKAPVKLPAETGMTFHGVVLWPVSFHQHLMYPWLRKGRSLDITGDFCHAF